MKKIVCALTALSMVALLGLTSCNNEPKYDPIEEFVAMGKYVGMQESGVKEDLVKNGWTDASSSSEIMYTKTVNNNKAVVELGASSGVCTNVEAGLFGNYYEDAKSMLNKVGATYTFPIIAQTANFTGVFGTKANGESEIQPDFAGAQGCVNNNSYTNFIASWATSGSAIYMVAILTDSVSNGSSIAFGLMD